MGLEPISGVCVHNWSLSEENPTNKVGFAVGSESGKSQHRSSELSGVVMFKGKNIVLFDY